MPITVSRELKGISARFDPITGDVVELTVDIEMTIMPPGAAAPSERFPVRYNLLPELTAGELLQVNNVLRILRQKARA